MMFELTPKMKVLLLMHSLSAINEDSAKRADDIAKIGNMHLEEVKVIMKELAEMGYIIASEKGSYLSSVGIINVLSLFS
jgi:predicted transport protein